MVSSSPSTTTTPTQLPETHFFLSRSSYPLGGTIVGTILIRPRDTQRRNDDDDDDDNNDDAYQHTALDVDDSDDDVDLRSVLESVTVFVAGYNKIDPRWHNPTEYTTKLYGPVHPLIQDIHLTKGFDPELLGIKYPNNLGGGEQQSQHPSSNVVCFWASNGLECLELPERKVGAWRGWIVDGGDENEGSSGVDSDDDSDAADDDDVENGLENKEEGERDNEDEEEEEEYDESTSTGTNDDRCTPKRNDKRKRRKNLLAFTFRVDVPHDLPPSIHATTCRYYYTAHVLLKTATQQQMLKRTFQITTHPHHQPSKSSLSTTSGRVKFGTCQGMAHSIGLPCHLSSMDIHRPIGQISVQPPFDVRRDRSDIQTIRVCTSSTPSLPVCLLTIVGSNNLTPNSRIQLQWDFPSTKGQRQDEHTSYLSYAPCYQIAACLKGEELAVYEDGTTKRTKVLLFDTCHEYVVPCVTQSITKTLWLDGSMTSGDRTPCEVSSDIMSLKVWCQVDITIIDVDVAQLILDSEKVSSDTMNGQQEVETEQYQTATTDSVPSPFLMKPNYSNLCLEIPVRVRHYLENEDEVMEQQENQVKPLKELLFGTSSNVAYNASNKEKQDDRFPTSDIQPDLKTLSLKVEELVRLG